MRRLIFGGSFNPVHHGHLACSRAVAEIAGFSRIILMPAAAPWYKVQSATLADPGHRFAMVKEAVAGDPLFAVNDAEIVRSGPSYTIDTARNLIASGHGPVHWLIGADMLAFLPKWHRIDELLAEVNFVVMARPGWAINWTALPANMQHLKNNVVEAPLLDIRATDIRARVAAGLSIRYLTPDSVCRYIEQHGLYR